MIVKVSSPNGTWNYYDGFSNVSVRPFFHAKKVVNTMAAGQNPPEMVFGEDLLDAGKPTQRPTIAHIGFESKHALAAAPDLYRCRWAVCHKRDGGFITIAFDQPAFLLNDEGKTVERI
jgi:hypothetical protein